MNIKYYWQSVKTAFKNELSRYKILHSCTWGVWIAFCPFMGFHTLLCIVLSWTLSLNIALVLAVSMFINNPWTMVPIYYFDYRVGIYIYDYLLKKHPENPLWLETLINYIQQHIHIPAFSFWVFIVGGTVTATITAFATWVLLSCYLPKNSISKHERLL